MKYRLLFLLLLCLIDTQAIKAQNVPTDSLDIFIKGLMNDFDVTGLSIGMIKQDSVYFLKGYGLQKTGTNLKVNEHTTFGIGSISKSFTALTLGLLVDEGKINWDDRVKDYLPYFELYDPYVTQHFTIRDLLTHKSGLKSVSGGTLWYHTNYSRTDIIKRLKHLEPVSGFREKPAYQNVMYVVAGEIVKQVSNMSWDDFLQTRILDKLDMKNSTSVAAVRESNNNRARPHVWDKNFNKVAVKQERGDNLAAAGFIYSSARDMIKYMKLMLNEGTYNQDTIAASKTIKEILKPQVLFPVSSPPFGNEFSSYGLGWWLTPIKGYKIIEHSGGIDGMSAQLFMIKELKTGVIILTNVSKEPASFLLKAKILEYLLGDKSYDIYEKIKQYRKKRMDHNKDEPEKRKRINKTQPSIELSMFCGTYTDRMYGDIDIKKLNAKEMELSFSHTPLFKAKLKHWHLDTFLIDWYDLRVPDGYLTFNFDSKGNVEGFKLDQENLLDVDFGELKIIKKDD